MNTSGLLLRSPEWLPAACALAALGWMAAWWCYRGTASRLGGRLLPSLCRALAVTLLALMLVEPVLSGLRPKRGSNIVAFLVDSSRSMQVPDAHGISPAERAKRLLADPRIPWRMRLEQDFDVRWFGVGAALEPVDDPSSLRFDDAPSSLLSCLTRLCRRFEGEPLAAVVLVTDGCVTEPAVAEKLNHLSVPIYPMLLRREETLADVAIRHVGVTQSAFEDSPIAVRADVTATGLPPGTPVEAQLATFSGELVDRQTVSTVEGSGPLSFRFRIRRQKKGPQFYRLRIEPQIAASISADEAARPAEAGHLAEATQANNERLVFVDGGHATRRILYVAGRPNWEFKFLRRALEHDERLELVALIRIARREPKFEWRGRAGIPANRLFRGFTDDAETAENYDEPVLVRLNTRNAEELRNGFPMTAEELFAYDAVVLDDVEAAFFTLEQMQLLERFVAERGGGLLMLGGAESFAEGRFRRTPVAHALPVYLDAVREPSHGPYRLDLTRDGWLEPWVRLRNTEAEERQRLAQMSPFRTANRVRGIKPAAVVLATATDDQGRRWPALVAQKYGRGRSAALLLGDLWRWQLRSEHTIEDPARAWRQMMRWLVADVPTPIETQVLSADTPNPALKRIRIRVRDRAFQPRDGAAVELKITDPDGRTNTLLAEPSLSEPGLYTAAFRAGTPGPYRVAVNVASDEQEPPQSAVTGFLHEPDSLEFASLQANQELIQALARETGGTLVDPARADTLVQTLAKQPVPVTETWTTPLWHRPWVLVLIVGLLGCEWTLRRWRGWP